MDTKTKTGVLAFALVGGLAAFGVCGVLIVAHGPTNQSAGFRSASTTPGESSDPWPECAAIRDFLRQHPDRGEVVKWGSGNAGRSLRGDVGPENLVYLPVELRTSKGVRFHMFVFGTDGRYREDYEPSAGSIGPPFTSRFPPP